MFFIFESCKYILPET